MPILLKNKSNIMSKTKFFFLSLLLLALFACTNKNLYFGTNTQIGLDVSGTAAVPNEVSFAFGRSEVAIVPKKSDDTAHSVFGLLDADITWFNGQKIVQKFATGCAAQIAADNKSQTNYECLKAPPRPTPSPTFEPIFPPTPTPPPDQSGSFNSLILIVKSKFGLDINFGQQNVTPELVLGYKRQELTVIPVDNPDKEVRSVYADISINSADNTDPIEFPSPTPGPTPGPVLFSTSTPSTIGGVRIVQRIATGQAAKNLVLSDKQIRDQLIEAVGGSAPTTKQTLNRVQLKADIIKKTEKLNSDDKKNQLFDWLQENYTFEFTGTNDEKLEQFNFIFIQKSALTEGDLNKILEKLQNINNKNGGSS